MTLPFSKQPRYPLSNWQYRLLEFLDEHPEALKRQTFQLLERLGNDPLLQRFLTRDIPIQSWPVLVDSDQMNQYRKISCKILRLVSSIPERFFALDAGRIANFYGYDPEVLGYLDRVLKLPWRHGGEIMRGDFYHDGAHLRCIEVNPAAYSGGLMYSQGMELLFRVPILKRFFDSEELQVKCPEPWHNLMKFMIDRAISRNLHHDGRLNLAIAFHAPKELEPTIPFIAPAYLESLAESAPGVRGKVFLCDYPQLERTGEGLYVGGEPVHILIQKYNDFMFAPVSVEVGAWLDGVIDLYAGPMSWLYNDKRNLALLWEGLEDGVFDHEERSMIENHTAWTARVLPGQVSYRGERIDLEPWVINNRERLVLKPAQSYGGSGISVGRFVPQDAWEDATRDAFNEGTYTVQEYVPSNLQRFQWGEKGCQLCEIVWGLFAFGDRFGGSYLRLHPPVEDGILNISKGVHGACLLEVGRSLEPVSVNEKASQWSFATSAAASE